MTSTRWLALSAIGLGLTACANAPKPVAELAAARAAVENVQPAGARYAPAQLLTAQQKLAAAQAAMDAENYERARRLAVEAEADAQLVGARTEAARARDALAEIQQGNQALRQELNRSVR